MSLLIWIGCGVLVADVVVLVVALAAMSGRADRRLEAMAVRRWLTASRPAPTGAPEAQNISEASAGCRP